MTFTRSVALLLLNTSASFLASGYTAGLSGVDLATSRLPAFPTAEGYGKYTTGGRGGSVLEVTNLADSGPGSLRAAIEADGFRTVVFRVSGTIDLQTPLTIRNPFITIAGQTAPGDGITLKRHPLQIGADEVIIRYLRVRMGEESGNDTDAVGGRYVNNVILDHVSASWSVDEVLSLYHASNVTVQWSIIAEPLFQSNHVKGSHGFGSIWGGDYSSYHHNLIAHASSRNPRFASGSGHTDFRNNVIYNWGFNSSYGGEAQQVGNPRFDFSTINVVANYYKPGPATQPGAVSHRIVSPGHREGSNPDFGKWYVAENMMVGNAEVTTDNWRGGVQPGEGADPAMFRLEEPWPAMPITQQSAENAYNLVLAGAGATLARPDAVDRRIVDDVRTGTASYEGQAYKRTNAMADASVPSGMIDRPADVGGWPVLRSAPAPADSDHDGMPDEWERAMKLDPNHPSDRNKVPFGGHTLLETYLNSLTDARAE